MSQTAQEALNEIQKPAFVPKGIYKLRVIEPKLDKTKSGDPMFVFECEVVETPDQVDPRTGSTITINGTKGMKWLSLSQKSWPFTAKFLKSAGLPLDITLENLLNNPNPEMFRGVIFRALCSTETKTEKNELTGQPVLDPDTQQPITRYQFSIGDVY